MHARPPSSRPARSSGLRRIAHAACVTGAASLLAGCDVFDVFRSFEAVCERRLPPTELKVIPEPVSYRVDRSLDYAALTRKGAALAGHGRQVLGLTEANLGYNLVLSARGMASRVSNRYCMRPSVEVKVGFDPMTVWMGSDAREGSCVDRLVWEHELKHVAVYQEYLGRFAAQAETALRAEFGRRVQMFATPEAGQAHVDATAARVLAPMLEASLAEVRALQRHVDSAEEYARVDRLKAACGD
jgi:hypothetical protein